MKPPPPQTTIVSEFILADGNRMLMESLKIRGSARHGSQGGGTSTRFAANRIEPLSASTHPPVRWLSDVKAGPDLGAGFGVDGIVVGRSATVLPGQQPTQTEV